MYHLPKPRWLYGLPCSRERHRAIIDPLNLKPLIPELPPDLGEPRSVAVVVPSYNHAKFIERTLRSIFAQTLLPADLLVIDDGSADDSVKIIRSVLRDAPCPAELLTQANRGLSSTLNEALRQISDRSSARFFTYIGSDDVWLPDILKKRVDFLESRPNAVLAYGNAYSIDADDRIVDCSLDWACYADGDVRPMLLEGTAPMSPTVVYRRSALEGMSWNENSRLEDYEFYLRLSVKGEFAYDPEVLSGWRQHGANTSEGSLMMMEEKISALELTSKLLDLDPVELGGLIRLAHFRGAQELMRRGFKSLAAKHGLPNLASATSVNEAARFVGGLATPSSLLARRRSRLRERSTARYGSL